MKKNITEDMTIGLYDHVVSEGIDVLGKGDLRPVRNGTLDHTDVQVPVEMNAKDGCIEEQTFTLRISQADAKTPDHARSEDFAFEVLTDDQRG